MAAGRVQRPVPKNANYSVCHDRRTDGGLSHHSQVRPDVRPLRPARPVGVNSLLHS